MKSRCVVALFLLLTGFAAEASGQDSLSWGWVGVGFGGGHGAKFSSLVGEITVNYVTDPRIYSLRYLGGTDQPVSELRGQFDSTHVYTIRDASILFGYVWKERFLFASASVGMSYVWGSSLPPPSPAGYGTIGLPFELQLGFTPLSRLGASISWYANVNSKASISGVTVCLLLGAL